MLSKNPSVPLTQHVELQIMRMVAIVGEILFSRKMNVLCSSSLG